MAVLDKVKYVISADSTEFRRELKKAGTVFDRWQRRHRRSLRALKRITAASVLGLTALTAGLGVKAVRSAARFESSIADAGAKAQATTEQLHALDKAAIKASSSSAFGANDAAKALSIEAQAGLSVKEQIQALRPELDLAAASHTNLGEATTISTKSLRAFRLQASQTGHVADVLTKASVSTNSTVSQLGEALGNAGAIAGQTHQSLETIVSVIGEMQDVGVPAAQAGTAIRSALGKLASTGSKARKELSKFVKVTDSQGQLRQFSSILEDLSRAVPNAQKRVSILSQAFGVKIGPKIVAATAKSADALEKFRQELIHSGGTASSIAAKQLDNFAGQLKVTGGKLDNLGVTVGKIFTPALKAATVTVGELSDKLRENVAAQKTLRNTTTAAAAGLVQSFAAGASIAGHTVDVLTLGYAGASEAADHLTKVTDKLANSLENSAAKAAARAAFGISRLKQQMEELAGKIRENNHSLAEHLRLLAKYHDLRDKVTHQDRISKLKKQASIYDEVNKKLAQQQHLVIQLIQKRNRIGSVLDKLGVSQQARHTIFAAPSNNPRAKNLQILISRYQRLQHAVTGAQAQVDKLDALQSKALAAQDQLKKLQGGADGKKPKPYVPPQPKLPKKPSASTQQAAKRAGASQAQAFLEGMQKAIRESNRLDNLAGGIKDKLDPLRAYRRQLAQIGQLERSGRLTALQAAGAQRHLAEQYVQGADTQAAAFRRLQQLLSSGLIQQNSALAVGQKIDETFTSKAEQAALDWQNAIADARSASQKQAAAMAQIDRLQSRGLLSQKQAIEAKDAADRQFTTRAEKRAQDWADTWHQAGQSAASSIGQTLGTTLDSVITGNIKSARQAMRKLALTLTKAIIKASVLKAVESAGGNSGGILAQAIQGFASGGYVSGPGTSTSDSIRANLSDGEYVHQAPAVAHYGVGFMESINQLKYPKPAGFASGGLARAPQGNSNVNLRAIIAFSEEDIQRAMAGAAGEQIVLMHAKNNPEVIRQLTGSKKS